MTDLHTRFRTLDDLHTPDLWHEIEGRALAVEPRPVRSLAWVLIAVTLLLTLALGGAILIGSGILKLPVSVEASASPSATLDGNAARTASPSASLTVPLLIEVASVGHVGPSFIQLGSTVLADGRVIQPMGSTLAQRRLTPSGLAQVRDLIAHPLLAVPGELAPIVRPGVEVPGHGGFAYRFTLVSAAGEGYQVWVTPPFDPALYEPNPEIDELLALAGTLLALDDRLPADAWADPSWSAYLPDSYVLRVVASPLFERADSPELNNSVWPLAEPIDTFGIVEVELQGGGTQRCALLTVEQANAALALFGNPDVTPLLDGTFLEATYQSRERSLQYSVYLTVATFSEPSPCIAAPS